jgi:hypothetical protein
VGQPGQGFEDDARFKIRVPPAVCVLPSAFCRLPSAVCPLPYDDPVAIAPGTDLTTCCRLPPASCLRVLREKAVSARSAREHKAWGAASVASKPQHHGTKKRKSPRSGRSFAALRPCVKLRPQLLRRSATKNN